MESLDDFTRSLIDQYIKGPKNEEFEASMMTTLFQDQKYDLVLYALEKGFLISSKIRSLIFESGDLKLYQYLHSKKTIKFNVVILMRAVISGNLNTVQWLLENKCPWNRSVLAQAARYGHIDIIKWQRANGYPYDEWICAFAAAGNQKEVLEWLLKNECLWDEKTCSHSAQHGHLEILKWARANGCPWDIWTCIFASEKGHLETLKWAIENGCPYDLPMLKQFSKSHPHVLDYLNTLSSCKLL